MGSASSRRQSQALKVPEPGSLFGRLSGFCFWGLIAALLVASLPLGSNRPWAVSVLALWLWALLLVGLAASAWKPGAGLSMAGLRAARWPLLLLCGFALVLVVQLLPWPHALRLQWLPLSVPPEFLGVPPGPGPLTLDAYATQTYLITTLAYVAAFALVVGTVDRLQRVALLLGALVMAGVLQAVLAILLTWADARYTYFWYDFSQGGRAQGTFPNADHLAGYMELCLAAGLGLLMAQFAGRTGTDRRRWQARLAEALQFVLSPKMLLRMVLVLMVIALVMTHSRMGNAAFFLAMLAAGALVAWRSPRLRRPALWLVLSMVVVDLIVIGQWVGLERVVERLQGTVVSAEPVTMADELEAPVREYREESLEARMRAPLAALKLVQDSPITGHGGGTFFAAFPRYKTPLVYPGFFHHAHNDYVEVAADTGLLGLALWLGVGVACLWRGLALLGDRHAPMLRGAGLACTMAVMAMGLHSVVDFNLQIPANALTFTTLLALVWARPEATA